MHRYQKAFQALATGGQFRRAEFHHLADILDTAIKDSAEKILADYDCLERDLAAEDAKVVNGEFTFREMLDDLREFEYRSVTERYTFTVWNATFLTIYSQFERDLNLVCLCIKHALHLPQTVKEMRGHGIPRSIKYLKDIAGLTAKNHESWARLANYTRLRNLIAHNGGRATKNDSHLHSFIANTGGVGLDKMNIQLSRDFVEQAAHEFYELHTDICSAVIQAID